MTNITYSINNVPIRLSDERWIYYHCFLYSKDQKIFKEEDTMATTAAVEEIFEALPHIKKIGAKHLWFDFDEKADVLYISLERPQKATNTDILEDGIFLRLRDKKIVGVTITNISEKFKTYHRKKRKQIKIK